MQKKIYLQFVVFSTLLAIFLSPLFAVAATTKNDQTSAADVQRELKETLNVIASYSAEQRDAALAKAKEALGRTDGRIEKLQQQIELNWQSMNGEARAQAKESLKALRKQRTDIAEWYGGLKHSSGNAWDEIKKGFSNSYTELEKSLEKAREKF